MIEDGEYELTEPTVRTLIERTGLVPGQVRWWDVSADNMPSPCFVFLGFRGWWDHEPTAVVLASGKIENDWYVSYILENSRVMKRESLP